MICAVPKPGLINPSWDALHLPRATNISTQALAVYTKNEFSRPSGVQTAARTSPKTAQISNRSRNLCCELGAEVPISSGDLPATNISDLLLMRESI
jgi:hypothetical protein